MLPGTFERDPDLRTTQAVIGVLGVALLTAGFSLTGLICFALRNPLFQADSVFLPSLLSCALGLLNVFYNFLVFDRYTWNTPAVLTAVAAAVSTVAYAGLLFFAHRKITKVKANRPMEMMPPAQIGYQHQDSETTLWQDARYYENYTRNMWPTAHPPDRTPAAHGPTSITEEEMQRQQMLMLLLQQKDRLETPDATSSTFHIDWREDDDNAPAEGYYAPGTGRPATAHPGPSPGMVRQWTNELEMNARPWDGVWRTVDARNPRLHRPQSRELREARRLEIEQGRR